MAKLRLPGGRGPRKGDDALVDTQNEYQFRKEGLSEQDGYELSVAPYSGTIATGVTVANSLRIYPLPVTTKDFKITKAQIALNVASAGGFVRAAIYKLDTNTKPRFVNVPGTTATFSTTSTGIVTFTFAKSFVLMAGTSYYVAFVCDNAVASITLASGGGNNRAIKCYTATLALTSVFPAEYVIDAALASSTNANWYQISYLSSNAARVL